MPLLDHFHPPLHGPRRWEGFHHAWATTIAQHLNRDLLQPGYFAEPGLIKTWALARAKTSVAVGFSRVDGYEVRVCQELGGGVLRGAIELVCPANKDSAGARRTFAAKCAGHLQHGIGVVIVDVVTARPANLHGEIFLKMEAKTRHSTWKSPTGLYAVAYRPMTVRKSPRVEAWPETLTLGKSLPTMPLWLSLDLCVPVELEASYLATCTSLRISA